MKKLATLLIIIISKSVLLAQNDKPNNNSIILPQPIDDSKFSFGLKGGLGHSFLIPYTNYAFMPSWNAGLSAIYSPFEHLGFGLDAIYSKEGVKLMDNENSYTYDLNYIRVPFKVIYFCNTYEKDFRPKISIGPTIGFLTNTTENLKFNNFDFGANASLGFNYRLARAVWLNVDATYYQGFIDINTTNFENDLNGNLRLELGLNFGF